MNKQEALQILRRHLSRYRERPYAELVKLQYSQEVCKVTAESGVTYNLEFQAFIDEPSKHTLRVLGSIDDGGIRAFFPLSEGFIIAPDGSFVDK
jgi:hypothetical protein